MATTPHSFLFHFAIMLPFNVSYFVLELFAYIVLVERKIRALPISFEEIFPVFELACVATVRIKYTVIAI